MAVVFTRCIPHAASRLSYPRVLNTMRQFISVSSRSESAGGCDRCSSFELENQRKRGRKRPLSSRALMVADSRASPRAAAKPDQRLYYQTTCIMSAMRVLVNSPCFTVVGAQQRDIFERKRVVDPASKWRSVACRLPRFARGMFLLLISALFSASHYLA